MNKDKHLDDLQIKLTVVFTLLVFFISSILQVSYFSYKYFDGIKSEIKRIDIISNIIGQRKLSMYDIGNFIKNEKRLGEIRTKDKAKNESIIEDKGKILNFIIFDNDNNIFLQNIRGNIDIDRESVNEIIKNHNSKAQKFQNTIINYVSIEENKKIYKVFILKELNYDYDDYISDMFRFFIAISLFSLLFFIIGFFFVKRNLKTVRKNMAEMNNFIQDAGHELKTPIAAIDSNLQLMKQIGIYNEEMIEENLGEIKRLTKLIEALSELSDLENYEKTEKYNIQDEIEYIINDYDSIIQEKNIKILYKKKENFTVECNKEYFYIGISNIIKNAIKFSKNKGEVHISYSNNILEIQDFGCGIQAKNLEKIYDRFYQENTNRNGEGFGIGLSLVSKICNQYNWKIDVKSIEGEGTKFSVNFQ